jgi:hypothetical protein
MQHRRLSILPFATVAAASAIACVSFSFAGCGSSSSGSPGTQPAEDSGASGDSSMTVDTGVAPDTSTPTESGAPDTGTTSTDGAVEAGPVLNCNTGVGPGASSTKLLASNTQSVQGVTSDGQVALWDSSAKSLSAIPVTGGTATMIDAYDGSGISTSGPVIEYFNAANGMTPNVGALSIWTAASGKQTLGAAAYLSNPGGGYFDVSADGTMVLYFSNATAKSADLYVSKTDGTGATKLVAGATYGAACGPEAHFLGNDILAITCSPPSDSSTFTSTITVFSGASWTPTVLSSSAFVGVSWDKAGTEVSFLTAGGQYVQKIGSATAQLIDATGEGGATFSPDGTTLYYLTMTGLYSANVTSPTPTKVAGTVFAGSFGVSPDGKWIENFENENSTTFFTDLYLTSTAANSTPLALVSSETAAFFSDMYTVDGSQALFFGNVGLSGMGYVGDFEHIVLGAGNVPATIAHNVWQGNATHGTNVLYNDNYVGGGKVYGYADIESLDLGTAGAKPTTLVSEADANYWLTADKKTLVYSFSACPTMGTPGVYTMPVP